MHFGEVAGSIENKLEFNRTKGKHNQQYLILNVNTDYHHGGSLFL